MALATQESYAALNNTVATFSESLSTLETGVDESWLIIMGTLVFLMQAGFAMLEAGNVGAKNTLNILFKNLCDACIAAICFWLLGFGFAYGASEGGFIGHSFFALEDQTFTKTSGPEVADLAFATWFFQFAFAATAATIVSGSVAERCKLDAYFIYSAVITTFIYPIVVHWGWGNGWMSPFAPNTDNYLFYGDESNNFIDFAGSGIVHMVGGFSGLMAAVIIGPRRGRFAADGTPQELHGHNLTIALLGVMILWVGWYGFNAGSTLAISGGASKLASKVAVTTTISAAFAGMSMVVFQKATAQKYDLNVVGNAIIAGLVSITAPCAVVEPWAAMMIGIFGSFIYLGGAKLLLMLRIDDPLEAAPIHGFCGFWGVMAVGIFGSDHNAAFAGYVGSGNGYHPFKDGEQFGVQLIGGIVIMFWTMTTSTLMFLLIKYTIGLRVEADVEERGLDASEHGAKAYNDRAGEEGGDVEMAPTAVVKTEE